MNTLGVMLEDLIKAFGCLARIILWTFVVLVIGGVLISAYAPKSPKLAATVSTDKACAQAVKRWMDNGRKSWDQMSTVNKAAQQQEWLAAREIAAKMKTDFNSIPTPTCYEYALVSGISNSFNNSMDNLIQGLDSAQNGNYTEATNYINMATSEIDSATSYADRLNAKLSLILGPSQD